jgi:hypothetical protein
MKARPGRGCPSSRIRTETPGRTLRDILLCRASSGRGPFPTAARRSTRPAQEPLLDALGTVMHGSGTEHTFESPPPPERFHIMATTHTAPKSLKPVETVEDVTFDEPLPAIEAAIPQVVDTFGVTVQRARLKGIRALAYQALVESIEAGDLEALTLRAIGNVGNLPTGWTVNAPKRAPKPRALPRGRLSPPASPTSRRRLPPRSPSPAPCPRAARSPPPRASSSRSAATSTGSPTPLDRRRPSGERWGVFCHVGSGRGCRSALASLGGRPTLA